jgi:membrane-bound lytic murein transglycosylase D
MNRQYSRLVILFLVSLFIAACSHQAPKPVSKKLTTAPAARPRFEPVHAEDFIRPAELEPQVAFWRNVYAAWSQSEAAIHDDRYLDVVYEVVKIPGAVGGSLSPDQRAWLQDRRDKWKARLSDLEAKVAAGQPLDRGDRELLARLDGGRLAGAAERVRSQRGLRERFRRGLEISARYEQHFRRIFRDAGLPEDLAYLPHVESSFQAAAKSSAGAVGIWQFTRAAAERYMTVNEIVDERLDPIAATRGAARYLRDAYNRLGSWPLALTSYNHGVNGMQRAKNLYGGDLVRIIADYDHPQFGFASRNFYTEFLAARDIARQPERYFAGKTQSRGRAGGGLE